MPDPPRLTIVVPCFDEAERIPLALDEIARHLGGRRHEAEVLLVDDGSRDGTERVAARRAAERGLELRVLRHEPNRGKGFAVRRGLQAALGDLVLLTDADLSVSIDQLDALRAALGSGVDLVIGSRRLRGAEVRVHQPWWRERMGSVFRNAAGLLAPGVSDFTCGFKLLRRDAARAVARRQRLWGWGYDVELLVIARRLGLGVREAPVRWRNDPSTRVRIVRDTLRSAFDLARIAWHDRRGAYAPDPDQ